MHHEKVASDKYPDAALELSLHTGLFPQYGFGAFRQHDDQADMNGSSWS